jgi:hypothetical protein
MPDFRQLVERDESASRLDRRIMLACGILLCRQSLQNTARQIERAIPFGSEPFLKRLGIDGEIAKEFATVQVRRRLQIVELLRTGEALKATEIDIRGLNATAGKIGSEVKFGAFSQSLAQFQQTVAQTVASLIGTLIRPEQVGKTLPADGPARLRRQIGKQGARLARRLAEALAIQLDRQGPKNADRKGHPTALRDSLAAVPSIPTSIDRR